MDVEPLFGVTNWILFSINMIARHDSSKPCDIRVRSSCANVLNQLERLANFAIIETSSFFAKNAPFKPRADDVNRPCEILAGAKRKVSASVKAASACFLSDAVRRR